jgi:hypothetical protein
VDKSLGLTEFLNMEDGDGDPDMCGSGLFYIFDEDNIYLVKSSVIGQ